MNVASTSYLMDRSLARIERHRLSPPDVPASVERKPFACLSTADQLDALAEYVDRHRDAVIDTYEALADYDDDALLKQVLELNNVNLGAWLRDLVLKHFADRVQEARDKEDAA